MDGQPSRCFAMMLDTSALFMMNSDFFLFFVFSSVNAVLAFGQLFSYCGPTAYVLRGTSEYSFTLEGWTAELICIYIYVHLIYLVT